MVNQGDLFVTKSSTPVRSRQLLGGSIGDPILRLQFRAQNEDIDVTNIQLNSSGSTATSVDRLDLYKAGETTAFASATVGGCGSDDVLSTNATGGASQVTATFCASMQSRQLVVKKGQNLDVLVYPRLKTDEQGATSNQTIQLFITKQAVSNTTTGSGAIRARGAQSSNNLDANGGVATSAEGEIFIGTDTPTTNSQIVGNVNKTVLAKYTQIVNINPDADNTNVPTGVSAFGQFKFTAAANSNTLNGLNKAVLSGVIFNVNATNVTLDRTAFFFYNKSDTSAKNHCTPVTTAGTAILNAASGSFLVVCRQLASSTSAPTGSGVNTKLDSGANATFVLEGNITNAKVSGSSTSTLQAAIQDFTLNTYSSFSATTSHIEWADQDTSTTLFNWVEYPETVVKSTSYKS